MIKLKDFVFIHDLKRKGSASPASPARRASATRLCAGITHAA